MQCMKCGRDIQPEQVFCSDCLAKMEKRPVKPGTVVQLPKRSAQASAKKQSSYRYTPAESPEQQIKKLKKRIVCLTCALLLTLAALTGLLYLGADHYFEKVDVFLPGQNYSSSSTGPAASN